MPRGKTNGSGRLRKIECHACQMILYSSRGAVIRHGMPRCGCGANMFFAELEDALAAAPDIAHLHPDFAAYTEREIQSAMRAAGRVGAAQLRCGGCNAWIARANERHSCGFHNDVRGDRNYGRWVEGASRAREEMPF